MPVCISQRTGDSRNWDSRRWPTVIISTGRCVLRVSPRRDTGVSWWVVSIRVLKYEVTQRRWWGMYPSGYCHWPLTVTYSSLGAENKTVWVKPCDREWIITRDETLSWKSRSRTQLKIVTVLKKQTKSKRDARKENIRGTAAAAAAGLALFKLHRKYCWVCLVQQSVCVVPNIRCPDSNWRVDLDYITYHRPSTWTLPLTDAECI